VYTQEVYAWYAHEVYVATKVRGWDGREEHDDDDDDGGDQQWNFASSLLYAITVVTTIGTTTQGRRSASNYSFK